MGQSKDHVLVYSTESGEMCPECERPKSKCKCAEIRASQVLGDGKVRVRKETGGRGGKVVTTITGLPLTEEKLKGLLKELKNACGTGGALKSGVIEIQGDKADILVQRLKAMGYDAKRAGG